MSAASQGAASGVVVGIVVVLLGQQFGYYSLSELLPAVEYLLVGAVVGAILFGLIGWGLGHLYRRRHPEPAPAEP